MRTFAYSEQSDPVQNIHFRRRWVEPVMSSRELQHLADLELARGNRRRADLLAWRAQAAREVRP